MAKKQSEKPDEAKEKPAAAAGEQPAGTEAKKPRAPKAKAPKADASPSPAAEPAAPVAPSAVAAPAAPTGAAPTGSTKKKGRQPGHPPRRGKKLLNKIKNDQQKIGKTGSAPLKQAIALLKQLKRAKFDETVEVHMSLGIDTTQSDQMIRGSVPLPHGLGKVKRVVVFCQGDNVAKAKDAGADFAGGDELVEKVQKEGWLDFDVALATQDMMGKVSRLGKVLGPRGLMPTPKAGTVITAGQDVAQAVREQKAGKVEYRADKGGNVHAGIGKISFDDEKLAANITAFVEQVRAAKPSGVKGHYVKSITIAATMTPGIPVTM
ncbi:MAG TPA: 50S ribosomal protein L1 [Gemmataceae bacterium]|jgi:large subunit ribosomal protein L1